MKKLLTSMLCTVALAPTMILANPLNHLLAADPSPSYGICGEPTDANTNFCTCFIDQSAKTCSDAAKHHEHGILKPMCKKSFIRSNIKHTASANGFCSKWSYMLPSDVNFPGCVESINYYKSPAC